MLVVCGSADGQARGDGRSDPASTAQFSDLPTQPEFLGSRLGSHWPLFYPQRTDTRKPEAQATLGLPASAPPGTRTPNLLIKRELVYRPPAPQV